MNAQIKIFRNTVIIYYCKEKEQLRISTGLKIEKRSDFDGLEFKKNVPGSIMKNKLIRDKMNSIQNLIDDHYLKNKEIPSVQWLKDEMNKTEKSVEKKATIKDVYEKWLLSYKQKHPHSTVRNYISVGYLLEDFCEEKKYKFMTDIDEKFMNELDVYIMNRFSNSTGKKRFFMIKYFLKGIRKGYDISSDVFEVKSSLRYKTQEEIVFFTLEELEKLKKIKNLTPEDERTRSLMLFLCYTGLRISDMKCVQKEMIKYQKSNAGNEIPVLSLYMQKTSEKVEIPLNKTAMNILEKYNYNLNVVEQIFNENIKDFLKRHEMCLYKIAIDSTRKNKTTTDFIEKYLMISSKTGRKTFISLLVMNKVSLNNIMACTGHKQLQIIVAYMNKLLDKELEFTGILDKTYTTGQN